MSTLDEALRQALADDGRTIYELAKQAELEPDVLYRFRNGLDIRLATAGRLAEVLGLELTHKRRRRTKTK